VPLGIYPTLIHSVFDMEPTSTDYGRNLEGARVIAGVRTPFVSIPVLVASEKSSWDNVTGAVRRTLKLRG
jgi:hypothetical protein